ncbi:Crotonobetainyl-CoA:carnitine CoA-transferase CaiB [Enhydrobacter aerosaccus]|uniref:Crotonobetainyl-CoA:carnitine CoA-transferase CaiB n=1 Tax=Enhydrobacter aerosaccus TaxID=225324 RepID=A0A1T4MTU5_9HYPH|nr:CaiB/BaiF CoA-transferase family protein [Enhydrobacter aerosaccus]SJZ70247.1 Crotonobetainyl-CoA:carnitine CoA-transferase CaiB [Enhydrobacter aerosaccus]
MSGALDGLLVVSVEQAVAAPYCSARLADAGARVIKIERPEGDFARGYDAYVHGLSSYFVWLNRGKQSVTLDFKQPEDLALLHRLIAKADVLIQNLAPGAADRAGFGSTAMRSLHERLITVDVSGYGDHGPYKNRRAYDLLVQAESGLASITGTEHAPGRVGISATDIGTGMYAHAAVLEALLARQKTGEGRAISVSLFSSMAEWMTVPVLGMDYSAYDWPRLGLTHPFIAPYGVYETGDKVPVLISIQNDREFERLCNGVIDRPGLEKDPDYATNKARNARRDQTNAIVQQSFGAQTFAGLAARLDAAQIAWARVSSVADLSKHPQLKRVSFGTAKGDVSMPALAATYTGEPSRLGDVPTLGQHTDQVRREFAA